MHESPGWAQLPEPLDPPLLEFDAAVELVPLELVPALPLELASEPALVEPVAVDVCEFVTGAVHPMSTSATTAIRVPQM